jgi:hypothetical protein
MPVSKALLSALGHLLFPLTSSFTHTHAIMRAYTHTHTHTLTRAHAHTWPPSSLTHTRYPAHILWDLPRRCTDRITKIVPGAYSLQTKGECARRIVTAVECFGAVGGVGIANSTRTAAQGADPAMPPGCSLTVGGPGVTHQSVYFNTLDTSPTACGGNGSAAVKLAGQATSLVTVGVELDASTPAGVATITLTGPADVWFGVAFGATQMAERPGAIIVDGTGAVSEYQLGDHVSGTRLPDQVGCNALPRQPLC